MSRTAPSPPAARTRPTLWVEVVLTLALITLATILLNAGVFWLLSARGELERHTELTLATARAIRAQLEAPVTDREKAWRRALLGFRRGRIAISALWVTDRDGRPVLEVVGEAPAEPDIGLRAALYGREEHVRMAGSRLSGRIVEVTEPLMIGGAVSGAVRVAMPWEGVGPARSGLGYVLLYTLFSGTVISVFGYALLRRRLVAPIQRIRAGTARIAAGEFGYTVELDAARELEELTRALNVLSGSLAEYRQQTAEQVESLERANQELRQVQEELIRSEKLASVGRLAAGIAHEVGNPLAAVLGYTELLAEGVGDGALERDLLLRTRREVERIHRIIRELLDYARPGTGAAEPVALPALLEEAVHTVRPQPGFREVEVVVEAEVGLPRVRAEADKLHQVFVNLLLNAADAVAGPGRITLDARAEDDEVVVRCRDSGPGFNDADLPKVFEPFFTTKEPGQGTGLGLATCQRIIEGMGGWIRASNHPEGGAVLTLGLPAEQA
ncbi:MAG: HAMP domain-containing protein [Alphaproteobacteria bacterium]|nr:HAMP domain-containing protein [Alphaproteobacteria bacterium]